MMDPSPPSDAIKRSVAQLCQGLGVDVRKEWQRDRDDGLVEGPADLSEATGQQVTCWLTTLVDRHMRAHGGP